MLKYPRTAHIRGSRKQPGDEDLDDIAFRAIWGDFLIIEEKIDGSNVGISFDEYQVLSLQSRGHTLTGGYRERQFSLFKAWAVTKGEVLWKILGNQFIMYGEWMYAKHTSFYDTLPHFFLEFDIFDKHTGLFLSTERRHQKLCHSGIVSMPVLHRGPLPDKQKLVSLIGASKFRSAAWADALDVAISAAGMDKTQVKRETDMSRMMEGLYVKIEDDGIVKDRYKYVRHEFSSTIEDSDTHWMNRPILPNMLAEGVDIFALTSPFFWL